MKKSILILLITFLAGQLLSAGPVSPGKALEIGQNILGGPATRTASPVSILWDGESSDKPKTMSPAFYVVGREEGGFVIISANDNACPVLAISESNRFRADNMPDNVRWWMEHLKGYVRAQTIQSDEVRTQWARLNETRANTVTGTVIDKVEHLTPEWNQTGYFNNGLVYNKFCPYIRGQWTYSGCVPTALAEVLTTLSGLYPADMPARGIGRVGGYTPDYGTVAPAAYDLATTYDWANLRTLTDETAIQQAAYVGNTALLDNLGHLMADCGAIVQASYGYDGTGAYVDEVLCNRMAANLYMSKTARVESYDDYTASRWIRMLKDNLAVRPIVYSGVTAQSSGHAFVFDGYGKYNGTDVFHVNFGWGGQNNGYYFFNDLTTDLGDFSYQGVVAVVDFYPDARQQTVCPTVIKYITFTPDGGPTCNGITSLGPVTPGDYLSLRIGGIKNVGNYAYSGEYRFYQEDRSGNRIGYSLLTIDNAQRPVDPGHLTLTLNQPVYISRAEFGDRIAGYFVNADGNEEEIIVEGDGTITGDLPLVPTAFIRTETSYSVGSTFLLRLHNYGEIYSGTVWTITAPDGTVSTVPQSEEKFVFTQVGRYRIKAAVAPTAGGAVVEKIVTYVTVQ